MTNYRVAKYKAGDRIYVTNGVGTGCYGVIKEARNSYDAPVYDVLLDGEDSYRTYDEGNLQFESLLDEPIDFEPRKNHPKPHNDLLDTEIEEYVSNENDKQESDLMNIEIEDMYPTKPKFKVGDVVNVAGHPDTLYVVNEALLVEDETTVHLYDVSPIYDTNQDSLTCEGALLTFQYHDTQWAEYFTEGAKQNGLPAWRGGLYNFTMFYLSPIDKELLDEDAINKFVAENNPMIRPEQMSHIISRHTVYGRINDVLVGNGNDKANRRAIIMEKLGITENFYKVLRDIKEKLLVRNRTGLDYDDKVKLSNLNIPNLTSFELLFGAEFDQVDFTINEKTGEKEYVDHYPITMTNLHIMEAIREAYKNASRAGGLRIQFDRKDESSLPAPHNGKRLYEGYSSKYKLTIQFYYNFDMDIIETAYPVRMNNNAKKH